MELIKPVKRIDKILKETEELIAIIAKSVEIASKNKSAETGSKNKKGFFEMNIEH